METLLSCNVADLSPYIPTIENPWNAQKVQHLYRRLGAYASKSQIEAALTQTPTTLIESLINEASTLALTPTPEWGYWVKSDFDASETPNYQYRRAWQKQALQNLNTDGLRGRITLFWSNHFVTEAPVYQSAAYLFQYHHTLETHALGNFKTLTHAIGLTAPMLIYLNGYQNRRGRPNENYARELFELFTLGENVGYTQDDIVETARALTGWNEREVAWGPITFDPSKFDDGEKTIFGQTGHWGYDDVIDILFTERPTEIAQFICEKLYAYFISPVVDQTIVDGLAQTFLDANFEIIPVLEQLFKSNHFFDKNAIGAIIASPIDLLIGFFISCDMNTSESFDDYSRFVPWCDAMGQEIFDPPDVAGWQGDKEWINATSFTNRWKYLDYLINRFWQHDREQFRNFAVSVIGGNSTDPAFITKSIIDFFLSRELNNQIEYDNATDVFKEEVPQNYFEEGLWDLNWGNATKQVRDLLYHIVRIPELQLK
ncbi:DUF1800 family protein [Sungkyunkwania multivorans]|uniref:DUF1800 family protein n=1 Tax=Sungkyunkwania multivorans TaxID=1173618 RepID=A0ABW3CYF6_9FLAO